MQADFNQDGFADLAIGAPGKDVGTIELAGAISVLYGTPSGLRGTGSQLFTQVGSAPEEGDRFGSGLASGDFNRDSFADLAAGAPFETVSSLEGAGAVSIRYGSAGGVTTTGGQLLTQDSPGIPGISESLDGFGSALTSGGLGVAPAAASPSGSSPTTKLPNDGPITDLPGRRAASTRRPGHPSPAAAAPPAGSALPWRALERLAVWRTGPPVALQSPAERLVGVEHAGYEPAGGTRWGHGGGRRARPGRPPGRRPLTPPARPG